MTITQAFDWLTGPPKTSNSSHGNCTKHKDFVDEDNFCWQKPHVGSILNVPQSLTQTFKDKLDKLCSDVCLIFYDNIHSILYANIIYMFK